MNNFLWLEHWFNALPAVAPEPAHRITIESLPTPGWRLRVDLHGTPFDQTPDLLLKHMHVSPRDWMRCTITGAVFEGTGGPLMLGPILQIFRTWIETV